MNGLRCTNWPLRESKQTKLLRNGGRYLAHENDNVKNF